MAAKGFIKSLPHFTGVSAFFFLIISLALRSWSTSEATRELVTGDVQIGLFSACADMPCSSSGDECNRPVIFSSIGDCRQGHCINSRYLTLTGSEWNANNLCDKAATAAAFGIFALLMTFAALLFTSWRALAGRTVLWGYGALFSFIAGLSSLIAWAIWIGWQRVMNNEPSEDREGPLIGFDELNVGAGFNTQVIASLLLFANVFFCRFQWTCFDQGSPGESNSYALTNNPAQAVNPVLNQPDSYLQINAEEGKVDKPASEEKSRNSSTPL
eukprot:m.336582 g.336582  ORF g.336582 m.336582 type:complete len:271 (+) comp17897_c0_seq1:105-917(+)